MRTTLLAGPPRWATRAVQHQALRAGWAVGYRVAAPGRGPLRRLRAVVPETVAASAAGDRLLVETAKMTSVVGFAFDPLGAHPLVATCRLLLRGAPVAADDSPLPRLYRRYRPATATETLPLPPGTAFGPFDVLPPSSHIGKSVWTLTRAGHALVTWTSRRAPAWQPDGNLYFGPASPEFIAAELARIRRVLQGLRAGGYQPQAHANGHISGYLLVDATGDYRFVVRDGNHRAAALAALGAERVEVALMAGHPPVITEDALPRWSQERGGLFPAAGLRQLFRGFFTCMAASRLAGQPVAPVDGPTGYAEGCGG